MGEDASLCPECGLKFETSQALGSHIKFKHRGKDAPSSSGEALDLKRDFAGLLEDVGIRRSTRTITDIFFEMGGDSLENLDGILRLAGVTNPARALILRRWAQRVNSEVPEQLLRGREAEEPTGNIFQAIEKAREAELGELLMEDLRSRIRERRRQSGSGDETKMLLDKLERLENIVKDFKSMQNAAESPEHRQLLEPPDPSPQRRSSRAYHCDDPYHSQPCVVCGHCGFHGSIGSIPLGHRFVCPECRTGYFRDH